MKQGLCSVALFIAGLVLAGAQVTAEEIAVDSRITDVTVYPAQAQVTRSASHQLSAGEHSLIFENIPAAARTASFRASASGPQGLTLLGMDHRLVFRTEATDKKVAELERRILHLRNEVKREIDDRLDVFNQQKKFLATITQSATTKMTEQIAKGGMQVTEWRSAYAFVSEELRAANDSIRIVSLELEKVNAELQKLTREHNQLRTTRAKSARTVQIDVNLQNAGKVSVELQYVIGGATWAPLYDARMDEETGQVELSYLAEVTQRTGEDWEDVSLALSTANPASGTGPGKVASWILASLPSSGILGQISGGRSGEVAYVIEGVNIRDDLDQSALKKSAVTVDELLEIVARVPTTTVITGSYSTTFNIERKESIPSGEKAVRTSIGSWPLESEVELICRPRNREGVYRLVTLTNQDDAPLMPGAVSIFAATDFLGNARISDLITPSQEFKLPFGLDN
ncbi:MAG: mucoidy inhibitor MuiA family protein, partial [candidate division Zixibacteria bacterium]|nr:mucoidy inhibitor MuiA family protein [candidate division Zixibacteria bacterium]